jgi:intracellular sulfur oxidation DsrE/DsrF family protein
MDASSGRRLALKSMAGIAVAVGLVALPSAGANAAEASLVPLGAKKLLELIGRLAKAPRRRDFKTVPMILNDPDQWDQEALAELIGYRGEPKQVWDNTNIAGPWLNLMRNSLNVQVFSFRHADFLAISATHGAAHLALFEPALWEKYQFSKLLHSKYQSNTFVVRSKTQGEAQDYENPRGAFSPHDNTIPALQARGVAFLACHNAIWEIAEKLIGADQNPDKLSHESLAAELTNKLIPGVVLTPGVVGTIPELQHVGYHYAT